MQPYLIIDLSDRNIFPVIINSNGQIFYCVNNVKEMKCRHFSTEVYLEKILYDGNKDDINEWLNNTVNELINDSIDSFFTTNKKTGLLRACDIKKQDLLHIDPLRNPLYVLSQHGVDDLIVENPEFKKSSFALLTFILKPVIRSIQRQGFHTGDLNVIAIIPPYLSRVAQVILLKVLKAIGFKRVTFITHSIASALNALKMTTSSDTIVIHSDATNLHIAHVSLEEQNKSITIRNKKSITIPDLGCNRYGIINELSNYLVLKNKLSENDNYINIHIEKAFTGLIYGIFSNKIDYKNNKLKLTYNLLNNLINEKFGLEIIDKIEKALYKILSGAGINEIPVVTSGPLFMFDSFEKLIQKKFNGLSIPGLSDKIAVERPVWGLIDTLYNITQFPEKDIIIINENALCLTSSEKSCENIIPSAIFPLSPDEHRIILQDLEINSLDKKFDEIITVDLLWGNDCNPFYNTSLCTIQFDASKEDIQNNHKIKLNLYLKGINNGIKGKVIANYKNNPTEIKKLNFPITNTITYLNKK